jgi:hypothetical protein
MLIKADQRRDQPADLAPADRVHCGCEAHVRLRHWIFMQLPVAAAARAEHTPRGPLAQAALLTLTPLGGLLTAAGALRSAFAMGGSARGAAAMEATATTGAAAAAASVAMAAAVDVGALTALATPVELAALAALNGAATGNRISGISPDVAATAAAGRVG